MRFGSINWKNLKITILHNSGRCGSAHTLFRHRNDFSYILTKGQRIELEKLEKFHKDVSKHHECEMKQKEEVQEMVDGMKRKFLYFISRTQTKHFKSFGQKFQIFCEKIVHRTFEIHVSLKTHNFETLKKIEEKFASFVQKIIHESKQAVVTFIPGGLVIFFRRSLNEDDKIWKMVCSDGIRNNIFKDREEMKMITLFRCKEKDCKWKGKGHHWYVWSTHDVMDKEVGNKEGTFVEINEKLIYDENETLLRLVRESHPDYEGDDEALKIQLKRQLNMLIPTSSENETEDDLEKSKKKMKKKKKRKDDGNSMLGSVDENNNTK
ncbi:hypothetical protein CRE_26683 [Caenorhabditis remanei]|uniref:Uncharacterized protein n=1 Tax=Caenorhabditis remanei TaxID=31234 RepID=E3MKZ0_CAERE|nr:hypothetical protein CRE_26683 [Caenorhabditis remanei]